MRTLVVIFSLAVMLSGGIYAFLRYAPDRFDPFAPLDIAEAPSFLTAWKLQSLKGDPSACFAALDAAGISYAAMPDRETGEGCGFENAARLQDKEKLPGTGGLPMTCPMIAALAVWERHDLQPAAQSLLGTRVNRIEHFGSYACRNVNNAASGRRSEHARANALDVAGFRLEDGREVSVLRDWGNGGAEGAFLRQVHEAACGRFASVFGPDYNTAHANHFHFDMGGFGLCR
ncbi:extensin family protein [Pelagibius sp. 7325]|uniref:extensin-like domain-containing protein n=1 Tax=Pelagibius sp. 7325 TaxID=3131994 RepID=UPI0030EF56A6